MELTITYYENNEPIERETFSDFDDAVAFCEDRFNLKSGSWDYTRFTKDMYELYHYLYDEGIDVVIVEEENEEQAMRELAEKYAEENRCLCCDEIACDGDCTGY